MTLKRPMRSRVQQIFLGRCYTCHNFGHMARECKLRENASIEGQEQKKEWKKMKYQRFLNHKGRFYGDFHYCHKFGHKVVGCRIKRKDLSKESKKQTRSVSRLPHGKMSRRKEDSKVIEEIKISKISEVSKY